MKFRHKKTGNTYQLLKVAIDATNERDGTPVAIYAKGNSPFLRWLFRLVLWLIGPVFVREMQEFSEKFDELKHIRSCLHEPTDWVMVDGGMGKVKLCRKCGELLVRL